MPPQQAFAQMQFGPPPGAAQFSMHEGPGHDAFQLQTSGFSHAPAAQLAQQGVSRRKAVTIGINYFGQSGELRGCINDSHCMIHLLKTRFGFNDRDILALADDRQDPVLVPSRQNILNAIQWLMSDLQPGDSLFFHYSGHGSQSRNRTGDEAMDSTLCPVDYKSAGMIIDDELSARLINPLPPGVKMHVVIDACHSGTVLDLPWNCRFSQGKVYWASSYGGHGPASHKGTAGGLAIQFSACTDEQTAADTNALSGNVSTGAATFSFIQGIEQFGPNVRYGDLLHNMHRTLKSMGGGGGSSLGGSNLLSGLMSHGLSTSGMLMSLAQTAMGATTGGYSKQTPVLSSNEAFDLNAPLHI
jgi:hypothetical protein